MTLRITRPAPAALREIARVVDRPAEVGEPPDVGAAGPPRLGVHVDRHPRLDDARRRLGVLGRGDGRPGQDLDLALVPGEDREADAPRPAAADRGEELRRAHRRRQRRQPGARLRRRNRVGDVDGGDDAGVRGEVDGATRSGDRQRRDEKEIRKDVTCHGRLQPPANAPGVS